jgi:glutamyl-Q tRNA(Asp) synthetase
VAAVASYLQARLRGARWLLRIEDLDPPREIPGATTAILTSLERHGFEWDGPVLYQSRRHAAYGKALDRLLAAGHGYRCSCSRREIATVARDGVAGPVYPGTCRAAPAHTGRSTAIRLRTDGAGHVAFCDGHFGPRTLRLEEDHGDFVLRRADGLFAYHLAVVLDDADQGVTEVVRGADLLDLTPPQIHLQRLLGLPTPDYLHHPLAVDSAGAKLSKQTGARPLDGRDPAANLHDALAFLGQRPPSDLATAPTASLWAWALENWTPGRMPLEQTAPAPSRYEM